MAPSTRIRPPTFRLAWRPWLRSAGSLGPRCTRSWPALDAVIHVARDDSGLRQVAEVSIFVREHGSGLVRSDVPSSSALTATVCWVRVARQLERMLER